MRTTLRRPFFNKIFKRSRYRETPPPPFVHPYYLKEITIIQFSHCPIFGSCFYTKKIIVKIK